MWPRRINISKILEEYSNLYKNTPGVLDIQSDGFTYETIVVFFDRDFLKEELPSEYKGMHIYMYDVRRVLADSQMMIENITKQNVDLSVPETKTALDFFTASINICTGLLRGQTNEVLTTS